MASAPDDAGDQLFDRFLSRNGHETGPVEWEREYNKKQCPECGGLHDLGADTCSVCGWGPRAE
ncbi:hypothetical protein BRD17_09100 [Halobacteriales archaeon SW_7_68_16]|nr:MAG: hypothetical protein BRD17_09100 [Halobacteriales archaeon SW_7_68_16]